MAILQQAIDELQVEIMVFLFGLLAHFVLFGGHSFLPSKMRSKRKQIEKPPGKVGSASKGSPAQPTQPAGTFAMARCLKALLRQGVPDKDTYVNEIQVQLRLNPSEEPCKMLAGAMRSLGGAPTAELVCAVGEVLRERSLVPNTELGDSLLRACTSLKLTREFDEVLAKLEAAGSLSVEGTILAARAALSASNLEAALKHVTSLAPPYFASMPTASVAPQQLLQLLQLLTQTALKKSSLPLLLDRFSNCSLLTPWTVEVMLGVSQHSEAAACREIEARARAQDVKFTSSAYATLVRMASSSDEALSLFREASEHGAPCMPVLHAAALSAEKFAEATLATAVLGTEVQHPRADVAAAFIRLAHQLAAAAEQATDAAVLDVFCQRFAGLDILSDFKAGILVVEAALRLERPDVLRRVLSVAEMPRQVALLKSFGADRRMAEVMEIFQACPEKEASLYNALLDVCIDVKDQSLAEKVILDARAAGAADAVTYNTIIKKHLQQGDIEKALSTMESMRSQGGVLAPNCVTFNELLDAYIRCGKSPWRLIEEMKASGLAPNNVTCSIMLKGIQRNTKPDEVDRVMAFVKGCNIAMDEVLLSSLVEACVRAARKDHLRVALSLQRGENAVQVKGAHAFGSLIRACGFLSDMQGAWAAWQEMRSRATPTSITIGCMVEALAANGSPEEGLHLIHELQEDEKTSSLVNAIIYNSVLKGFSHLKQYDRAWDVYKDMLPLKGQFTSVTYNAIIDLCARSTTMSYVPELLEEMSRVGVSPNLVTYSTIAKGYCQENRLDRALELFESMKQAKELRPDEFMYNILIDGCACSGRYERGLALLEEMQSQSGVRPSAYTLTVIVKLADRARRPEKAFELCEELSKKYHLSMNVYIYNNLIHTCTRAQDADRALDLFNRMLKEKIRPDVRTYTLLLRGCMSGRKPQHVASLLRSAFGIAGVGQKAVDQSAKLTLPTDLVREMLDGLAGICAQQELATQLLEELRHVPGVQMAAFKFKTSGVSAIKAARYQKR